MVGKSGSGRASRRHTAGRVAAGLRSGATARLLSRLSALNVVEGSVRLAAQAFLTAFPLLMTIAAFASGWMQDLLAHSLRAVLDVRGDTLDEMRQVFSATGTPRRRSRGRGGDARVGHGVQPGASGGLRAVPAPAARTGAGPRSGGAGCRERCRQARARSC